MVCRIRKVIVGGNMEKRSPEGFKKKNEYIKQYHKSKMTAFTFKFGNDSEQDIIEYLNKQENKTGYIKKLIKADMERNDK